MLAIVHSAVTVGVTATPVRVEVHVAPGLPSFTVIGIDDTRCRELRDRVRAGIMTCGFTWPNQRVTVNVAPSDRITSLLDLPVAIGVLRASAQLLTTFYDGICAVGEVSLDGHVRDPGGILPALDALSAGLPALADQDPSGPRPRAVLVPESVSHATASGDWLSRRPVQYVDSLRWLVGGSDQPISTAQEGM